MSVPKRSLSIVPGARAAERAVAADDGEAVDAVLLQHLDRAQLARFLGELGTPAGLQEGAGVANTAGNDVGIERDELVVDQALVPVAHAENLQPLVQAGTHNGADGRVHAG
jgi:hypothetical protein